MNRPPLPRVAPVVEAVPPRRPLFQQLRDLSQADRLALAEASALLPAFVLALRAWGMTPVVKALGRTRLRSTAMTREQKLGRARSVARLTVAVNNRLPWSETCLPASLCLIWLLRRRGIECDLIIGVAPGGKPLSAHAWVEREGIVLNDRDDVRSRFSAFERITLSAEGRP